jgi:glycosyltransferase involved in cell wall biosynthesis
MTVALKVMTASRLSIGFFSESYLPRISGVVHSIEMMADAVRQQGHRVVVVAPHYRNYMDRDPDVIRYPSIRSGSEFPVAIPFSPPAWRRLQELGLHVIHTHSPFLMGNVGARLARVLRIPLIFTYHTLYDQYVHYIPWIGSSLTAPRVRAYAASYANRCDCVIAPSPTVAAQLRVQGVHTRIDVLATGVVDPVRFASLHPAWVRGSFGVPRDRPLVVTVSRLGKEKNVGLVLEAFALLRRRALAHLLVVGGGPEEAALRQHTARLGIAEVVHFAGLLAHQQALECMAAADLFLFASQTETQGLVVTEAMAAGVPVVAVAAGGVADTIRSDETGVLVPPSAEAMAEKGLRLLENPSVREKIRAQARTAATEYAPEVLSHRLIDLYRSLMSVGTSAHHPTT